MKKIFLLLLCIFAPIHNIFAIDSEVEKLQWHLNRVEWILRQVDTSELSTIQKENRTKMLDLLHSYTEAGKFPINDTLPNIYAPFFRWSNGNLCAVWYLMNNDPEYREFVDKTALNNNNIKIMDIQKNWVINSWAEKYGFSILELAMIQPTYDYCQYNRCCWIEIWFICMDLVLRIWGFIFYYFAWFICLFFSWKAYKSWTKFSKFLWILLLILWVGWLFLVTIWLINKFI